jgi:hypothetical protein
LAQRTAGRRLKSSSDRYSDRAEQEEKHAGIIREMLSKAPVLAEPPPPEMTKAV